MKKVAVIGLKGLPAFGGAASVGEALVARLKDDYDVTVLSVSSHTNLKSGEMVVGVKQIVFKSFGNGAINTVMYYIKCVLYVLFHKFDIVHLHHYATGIFVPIIKLRSKVVLTGHGMPLIRDPKFSKLSNCLTNFAMKIAVKTSDIVVSCAKFDSKFLSEKYNKEVVYIPNGIDIVDNQEKEDGGYILFAAGRIYPLKGLHFLVEALQNINYKGKLKVVGNIDRMPEYKSEIQEKSKGLDVEFVGLIKEKSKLMQIVNNAKLFVFPSITEAMSMMLLEVVSQKVPIIASNIPANTNIFGDEEMLFFQTEQVEDLTQKIRYALENEDDMILKVNKAYELLRKEYVWDVISSRYNELYKQVLDKKRI